MNILHHFLENVFRLIGVGIVGADLWPLWLVVSRWKAVRSWQSPPSLTWRVVGGAFLSLLLLAFGIWLIIWPSILGAAFLRLFD